MLPAAHRDQLISMLAEAAEIEHCLMCSYLYAVFSLKQHADEDLRSDELAAVRRWRAEVTAIASEEMLHLALVNNLLIAIGAPPHYRRFNFPIDDGLFPADVALSLQPFDATTLDHFIYLERPSDAEEEDGARNEKPSYQRAELEGRLNDAMGDYETVGELYRGIVDSLALLADSVGEKALFVGRIEAQLSEKDVFLPGLHTINSVAEAVQAIDLIVQQGEGARTCNESSHYARFREIRIQWQALGANRAEFTPYRAVARNPIMRAPVTSEARVQILAEPAATLLDLGNSSYVMMLRLLLLMSDTGKCLLQRAAVMAQAMTLMHAVADIGSALTALPANPEDPALRAGLTFSMSRPALGYESSDSAASLLAERFTQLAEHAEQNIDALPALEQFAWRLRSAASVWLAAGDSPTALPQHASAEPDVPRPIVDDDGAGIEVARGATGTIYFDARRCVHSRHCVLGEPEVFLANQQGEWIFPDRATPERIAFVAQNCVSGAIRYERNDNAPNEAAPRVNLVHVRENGPLAFHAALTLVAPDGTASTALRATLCRCGQSKNKPYCDLSHVAAGFDASGEAVTRPSPVLEQRDGPLVVTPLRDGPLDLRGPAEIVTGTGRTIDRTVSVRLCRCGHSNDKPFCDGRHREVGFCADGRGVAPVCVRNSG
jgi:CDGSH-type Zn-finger protein/uncharacterized Fe-S cluster protein YjdI